MTATYNTVEMAERSGCSAWLLYKLVKQAEEGTGECPFPFIRLGTRVVFPKAPCDRILGIEAALDEGVET